MWLRAAVHRPERLAPPHAPALRPARDSSAVAAAACHAPDHAPPPTTGHGPGDATRYRPGAPSLHAGGRRLRSLGLSQRHEHGGCLGMPRGACIGRVALAAGRPPRRLWKTISQGRASTAPRSAPRPVFRSAPRVTRTPRASVGRAVRLWYLTVARWNPPDFAARESCGQSRKFRRLQIGWRRATSH
jgi:hypothetical protein